MFVLLLKYSSSIDVVKQRHMPITLSLALCVLQYFSWHKRNCASVVVNLKQLKFHTTFLQPIYVLQLQLSCFYIVLMMLFSLLIHLAASFSAIFYNCEQVFY